jgi:hypothetical protein
MSNNKLQSLCISFTCINNPQVQGIDVAPLNMEVLSIKPQEKEGK